MTEHSGKLSVSVRDALARRSILERVMLAQHFAGGMSAHEIARALSIPVSTVLHRLAQSLHSVRCECAPQGGQSVGVEQIVFALSSGLAAPSGLRRQVNRAISSHAERPHLDSIFRKEKRS